MGKQLLISAIVLLVIGISIFIIGFGSLNPSNFKLTQTSANLPSECQKNSLGQVACNSLSGGSTVRIPLIINTTFQLLYNEMQASILIDPVGQADLTVRFLISIVQPQASDERLITSVREIVLDNGKQFNFDIIFSLALPSLKPGVPGTSILPGIISFYIEIISNSGPISYNVLLNSEFHWRILMPLAFIPIVISLVLFVFSFYKRTKQQIAVRPMSSQAAVYEPTLAGMKSSSSRTSSKGITQQRSKDKEGTKGTVKTTQQPTTSSAAKCRSCNKPIPKRTQYCPHCYARQ